MTMMDSVALRFFIDASGPSCLRARSYLSYCRHDLLGMERLLQQQTTGDRPRSDWRKPGCVDHRKAGIVLSASLGDLPVVDLSGQPDVGDQDVGRPPSAPGQRLLAVGRMDDVEEAEVARAGSMKPGSGAFTPITAGFRR
jgi:hypothetical protein